MVVSEIDLSSPLNYGTPSSHGGLAGVGSQGSVRTPGVRGTPIRVRSDIQSERRLRQVVTWISFTYHGILNLFLISLMCNIFIINFRLM